MPNGSLNWTLACVDSMDVTMRDISGGSGGGGGGLHTHDLFLLVSLKIPTDLFFGGP